ncbi:hypothetical protein WA026_022305 [Henosepilachna vigintioctopunctata]|uniref:Uncharacterized protein n=1 Tax=Henosepilachna vigintioctopunctata TaxID=420089 RepID=A0AAW1VJI4_9CUCU
MLMSFLFPLRNLSAPYLLLPVYFGTLVMVTTPSWIEEVEVVYYWIGSPPPAGSKNEVLIFRSVKSIISATANTGRGRRSKIAVLKSDRANKGSLSNCMPIGRISIIVVIKLIAPKIDDTAARCNLKIAKSTEWPLWAILAERGG